MRCQLCAGFGSKFCIQNGNKEWWDCPACGGAGTRIVCAPATIQMHKIKKVKGERK